MAYTLKNPVQHLNIGWLTCYHRKNYKLGGLSIRECDDYDRETFGAEFRLATPLHEEYIATDPNVEVFTDGNGFEWPLIINNPMYWSRPARKYAHGIEIWESDENDENGHWVKIRGTADFHDRMSQDKPLA